MASANRGSKKIDIVTPYGRLNRHTGFYTASAKKRVETIIDKLIEDSQLDVLKAIHDEVIDFPTLVHADREGKLSGKNLLDAIRLRTPLAAAVKECLPKMGKSKETRRRYGTSLKKLQLIPSIAGRDGKTFDGAALAIGDLAEIDWKVLERAPGFKSAADWNHLRRAVSALLTVFFGTEHHAFRVSLVETIPLRKERSRVPDLTPAGFWQIVGTVPEHARPCYITLAASGMRLGEYLACRLEDLVSQDCAIDIPSSKTESGVDRIFVEPGLWPWITAGIPSPLGERWMGIYWRRACLALGFARELGTGRFRRVRVPRATSGPYRKGESPEYRDVEITRYKGPRLHDLRHLFAQVADAEGLSTETVQAALRHTNPKQTSDYKRRAAARECAAVVGRGLLAAMPGRRVKKATRRKAG